MDKYKGFYAYAGNKEFFACISYNYEADRNPGADYMLNFHKRLGPAISGSTDNADILSDAVLFNGTGRCGAKVAEIEGNIIKLRVNGRYYWYLGIAAYDINTGELIYESSGNRMYFVGFSK